VRARDVRRILAKLWRKGIEPVNRSLWVNSAAVKAMKSRRDHAARLGQDASVTSSGRNIAYITDPDGNLICRYDLPEEVFDGPIPEHY